VISALGTTASDNLVITRDLLVTGTGNKTLTLAGVNIGDNTFAGVIPVSAGAMISLAKSEAGKWIVSGNNTATGTVSVAAGRLVLTGTNQFTGAITVNSAGGGIYGTLAFNSISNYGVASALGKGTAGAAIRLGNGTASPGALEYTGAGDSTDRIIKIGNNSSAGGAIYNNGSGPLIFTAAAFNEAGTGGAAPLTLGGSYGGVNEIQGIITNNTASAVSITKANDASIWALSGTNTYSGTTSVSGGKLFINGDQSGATGNVSVAASATLGGGGTVGGNVTVAANGRLEFDISTVPGSHNPLDLTAGRVLTFSGASVLTIATSGNASTGSYTLVTGGTNIVGSAPATVNLPAGWEGNISISGNSLLLNVTAISEGSCNLTVTSAYGTPSPAGVTVQASNSVVNAYIGGSPVTLGSIQYVATGWLGTGSAVSGTGTNTSFTITQDSTISWLWQTNYYITFGVEGE